MAYFLRKTKRNNDLYLQICETTYNKETKKSSNKNVQVLGYLSDLKIKISDPIVYFNNVVKELNEKSKLDKQLKVSYDQPVTKNIGYFLIKALLNTLNVKKDLNLMGIGYKYEKDISTFLETMIYCQIVKPSSKLKNAKDIIPSLYGLENFSEDQIYRMINFLGSNYKKYIELFNAHIEKTFKRNYNQLYFDCTNYYFEIDLPKEDKQKGPSKENRKEPIIGQALLLDGNQIPLCMEMYPGNESEKPYIRKLIEEMKSKCNIEGRTIQVADKGLNCAKNIYFATKEARDGYIFSKSVHGKNLSKTEKVWVLLDDEESNKWTTITDSKGKILYKFKSCIDTFDYSFIDDNGEEIKFKAKEKRVVSFNPDLARKQICEIDKQIERILKLNTIKGLKRTEYGDAVKYVKFKNGKEDIKITPTLDLEAIKEAKRFAGYNLIVTSEVNLDPQKIYSIYHGLWRIEESFRITKSYLQARPVYLQTRESIYGHFLICYLSLVLLRLLEFNVFSNELNSSDLVKFIRSFSITQIEKDKFISNILNTNVLQTVKKVTQILTLDNLYLTSKNIEKLLNYEF